MPAIAHFRFAGVFSLLLAATACQSQQKAPHPKAAQVEKSTRVPAARVGEQVIYVDEVDKSAAPELFEIRSDVLHRLVADRLLRETARKQGISVQELWNLEVNAKVPLPDPEDTAKALAAFVSSGRLTAEEASRMSPQDASEKVRRVRLVEREQAFFEALSARASVQVDFAAIGKPSLEINNEGPSLGPTDARLTVVEFADLTQSFTSMWQPTLEKLVSKHGGKVRFLFKQKPAGPDSPSAKVAEATLCANDQKMYWEFRKALFHQGKPVSPDALSSAAAASKLDLARFEECLSSGRNRQSVFSDIQEARVNRLEGEPVLAVNGVRLSGAQPFDTVDGLLKNEMSTL